MKQLACTLLIVAACGGDRAKHTISGTISVGNQARVDDVEVDDGAELVEGELIVTFRSSRRAIATRISLPDLELELVRPLGLPRAAIYRMTTERTRAGTLRAARLLRQQPDVESVTPNYIYRKTAVPNDTHYKFMWHYPAMKLPEAWELAKGSASMVVAVLDTGILYEAGNAAKTHPDFAGKILPGYDFITDVTAANDGNGRDANPFDPSDEPGGQGSYHGSHVAGTIAAKTNDGAGIAGVDWNAKILPVRVLGAGGGTLADIYEGLLWSAGLPVPNVPMNPNPAKVINLSLGGPSSCVPAVQGVIDQVLATGAIIVVAAGNNNVDASTFSPASCNGVITVGATDFAGKRAPYSNFGARIDVMAPGGDTSVDLNGDGYSDGVLSAIFDDAARQFTWKFENGTSMAAPHVAGLISLMKSVKPDLTAAQALMVLKATARPMSATQCNASGCGAGIIDAHAALLALQKPMPTDPPPPAGAPQGRFVVAAVDDADEIVDHVEHAAFTPDYRFADLDGGDYRIVGWIDVNDNANVDKGDYFGASPVVSLNEDAPGVDFAIVPVP